MSTEKVYSTDANVLGATHEAKDLERLDASMRIVQPIMGVAHWKQDVRVELEEVTVELSRGIPVAVNGERHASLFEQLLRSNEPAGAKWARDERPDREPRHRCEVPRRLRGPGDGAAERRLRTDPLGIHNENTTELYVFGRRLGRFLYEVAGRWYDPESLMLKEALTRWVALAVTDGAPRASPGTTTRSSKRTPSAAPTTPEAPPWRRRRAPSAEDRIGALEMQSSGSSTTGSFFFTSPRLAPAGIT